MPLVQINKNPSRKDLRWFGLLFGVFFGVVGGLAFRRSGWGPGAYVPWALAAVVPVLYYAIPPLRRPIYLGWTYLVFPIGLVVSFAVLAVVWFAVVTPVGLLLRLAGRDPLERAFDARRATYWVEHRTGDEAARYFRQY
jgi:saxitoxin biosynthesis operon SxtJ-like protein